METALAAAIQVRDAVKEAADLFLRDAPPEALLNLNKSIATARVTKAENVFLACVQEHRSKPIRLKRVIRDHIHNLSDVWNNVHAIVKQLADTMSATMVKEPKVD